jgi:hypothetical protein
MGRLSAARVGLLKTSPSPFVLGSYERGEATTEGYATRAKDGFRRMLTTLWQSCLFRPVQRRTVADRKHSPRHKTEPATPTIVRVGALLYRVILSVDRNHTFGGCGNLQLTLG